MWKIVLSQITETDPQAAVKSVRRTAEIRGILAALALAEQFREIPV